MRDIAFSMAFSETSPFAVCCTKNRMLSLSTQQEPTKRQQPTKRQESTKQQELTVRYGANICYIIMMVIYWLRVN